MLWELMSMHILEFKDEDFLITIEIKKDYSETDPRGRGLQIYYDINDRIKKMQHRIQKYAESLSKPEL